MPRRPCICDYTDTLSSALEILPLGSAPRPLLST